MKSLYKLALSLGLTAIGLLGLQGSAMALTTINANICTVQTNTAGLTRTVNGVSNASPTRLFVFCPVVRNTEATAAGWRIFVDGIVPAGQVFTCTLNSFTFFNQFLGQTSFTLTGAPGSVSFNRTLTLPQSLVPPSSQQSLFCALPPNGGLLEIEPDA